jgi:hypothetical protein
MLPLNGLGLLLHRLAQGHFTDAGHDRIQRNVDEQTPEVAKTLQQQAADDGRRPHAAEHGRQVRADEHGADDPLVVQTRLPRAHRAAERLADQHDRSCRRGVEEGPQDRLLRLDGSSATRPRAQSVTGEVERENPCVARQVGRRADPREVIAPERVHTDDRQVIRRQVIRRQVIRRQVIRRQVIRREVIRREVIRPGPLAVVHGPVEFDVAARRDRGAPLS